MSKALPLVSIVTPSYNHGRFIEDTILSIKKQEYSNIEHIIVDGGSTDNTLEILRKYEREYNLVWVSEYDKGQSDAVNKGFKMAKGEIIGWLNSDDVYFDTTVISYVVNRFEELKYIDIVYGDYVIIDESGFLLMVIKTPNWDYRRLLRRCFIGQPATFFRKKVVLENQLDKDLHLSMDYDFWLRLGKKYNFNKVNKILAGFRFYKGTKSFSNKEKHRKESKELMLKYGQKLGFYYKIERMFDILSIVFNRLIGVKDILELTNRRNLAFKIRIPDKVTRFKSQIPLEAVCELITPAQTLNLKQQRK